MKNENYWRADLDGSCCSSFWKRLEPAQHAFHGATFSTPLFDGNRAFVEPQLMGLVITEKPPAQADEGENYSIGRILCFLYPHHNLALIVNNRRFQQISRARKRLRDLGYVPAARRMGTVCDWDVQQSDVQWTDLWEYRNKCAIVRTTRSPKKPELRAFDQRGAEVMKSIRDHTSAATKYTFGVYMPRHLPTPARVYIGRRGGKNREVRKLFELDPDTVSEGLEKECTGLRIEDAIGISSKVQTPQGERHIPMIDFKSGCDEEVLFRSLRCLGMPGIVVCSGNSFHFYGAMLLDPAPPHYGLSKFFSSLSRLGEKGGIDEKWLGYQQRRGYAFLRLTPAAGRLKQPTFWKTFRPEQPFRDRGDSDFVLGSKYYHFS